MKAHFTWLVNAGFAITFACLTWKAMIDIVFGTSKRMNFACALGRTAGLK